MVNRTKHESNDCREAIESEMNFFPVTFELPDQWHMFVEEFKVKENPNPTQTLSPTPKPYPATNKTPTPKLAHTKMLQYKKNPKVTWSMLQLTFICAIRIITKVHLED